MEKIIKINGQSCFTSNHLVKTSEGLVEAKQLKVGDEIIGISGKAFKVCGVVVCDDRPDAPVVGELSKLNFLCGVGIERVDIVDLETAKYLKQLGFDKPTHWYWQDKQISFVEGGLRRVKYGKRRMNHNKYDEWIYSMPTKDEALSWIKSYNKITHRARIYGPGNKTT